MNGWGLGGRGATVVVEERFTWRLFPANVANWGSYSVIRGKPEADVSSIVATGQALTIRTLFVLIRLGLFQVRFCDDALAPFGRLDCSYVLGLLPR